MEKPMVTVAYDEYAQLLGAKKALEEFTKAGNKIVHIEIADRHGVYGRREYCIKNPTEFQKELIETLNKALDSIVRVDMCVKELRELRHVINPKK